MTSKEFHICNFCGKESEAVDVMVMGKDGTILCNQCIIQCNAILEDKKRDDIDFFRIPGKLHSKPLGKLRPVTRIPKHWVICKEDLLCSAPNVTACSPDGKDNEVFALPKQLALWMINFDKQMDVDQIRDELKKDMFDSISAVLNGY